MMTVQDGVELLLSQGAILSLFPIEQWRDDLQRMDTIAPILDPTAYREYQQGGRREMLLEVLSTAAAFKAAILRAQQGVLAGTIR